jgi:hypothetical protein
LAKIYFTVVPQLQNLLPSNSHIANFRTLGDIAKVMTFLRGINEVFLNLLDTLRILLNSLVILENDDSGHVY